jgi:hypothetical protein
MIAATLTSAETLAHLQSHTAALRLPRVGPLAWDDAALHAAAYAHDPALYALLALAPGVQPWQRARVLLQILQASRAEVHDETRVVLERVTHVLVIGLPPDHTLTALLALRRLRANHKHVTRAIVQFVLDHPHADALIRAHRSMLVDCFEHALGKATARGCARMLTYPSTADEEYLRRRLLRFTRDPETAARRVRDLYTPAPPATGEAVLASLPAGAVLDAERERPTMVTATNRGAIAATLVHLYRGGHATELEQALQRDVALAAANLPRFGGALALVLDASASARSYGDREYACLAQSIALRMVLERCCDRLIIVPVGGDGRLPRSQGASDLATALLDALEQRPDLAAIISDGYENVYPGDLARVVATLPLCGVTTPIVFCHSAFTNSDDLALRRPAPALPQRLFWHQDDFWPLLVWLFAQAEPALAAPWLRAALAQRLHTIEQTLEGALP